MPRVLILGATGFIGGHVAKAFVEGGFETHGAGRRRVRTSFQLWPLENVGAIGELLGRLRPDLVVNAIGYGVDPSEREPTSYRSINAELPELIVERMSSVGLARLIHFGTALEYGRAPGDLAEGTEPQPIDEYGSTKLAGSRAALERGASAGVCVQVIRLFTVYGPGEHAPRLLPTLLRARATTGPIALSLGTQRRDFTYVGDVAEGTLALARAEAPSGIYNLATGVSTTVRELVETAARRMSIDAERLRFGELPTRPNEMSHDPVCVEKLARATGFRARTTIAEGIRRTITAKRIHCSRGE